MLADGPRRVALALAVMLVAETAVAAAEPSGPERPSFILCMADDQGWGDVGYYGQSSVKTPVLDEMASSGLRLDRFYAAAPVCSPTRGSVLTGRHPNRFGCFSWGHTLRPQEVTVAEALRTAGYTTGHFGKWHVGPVRAESPVCPGQSGFDEWVSSPNFFENDPLLSDRGKVIETRGESSMVTVDLALRFIQSAVERERPFLAVVWFGSPHAPHIALPELRELYAGEPEKKRDFYGEITGIDRAMGKLRREMRAMGIERTTLLWYTSDNGALPVGSTGGLTGRKGNLGEGGIRVPAILEWPARIPKPRVSAFPCGTVDIYPTLLEIAGVTVPRQAPLDGISLVSLIDGGMDRREKPLGFWVHPTGGIGTPSAAILTRMLEEQRALEDGTAPEAQSERDAPKEPPADPGRIEKRYSEDDLAGDSAWIEGRYKLHRRPARDGAVRIALHDLERDPAEKEDLAEREPELAERLLSDLEAWQRSVIRSLNGADYGTATDSPQSNVEGPDDAVILIVEDAPADGLVVAPLDLGPAARWCRAVPVVPDAIRARTEDGTEIPCQFVPAEGFDGETRAEGTIALSLPSAGRTRVRLALGKAGNSGDLPRWDGRVETRWYAIEHDASKQGGLPWRVTFPELGKTVDDLYWQDRAYHPEAGSFRVASDRSPSVTCVSRGPLSTVVRVRARFVRPDGSAPPSRPEVTYDWWYFHDRPAIRVTGVQRQEAAFGWAEMHFLELHTGESLPRWGGGDPFDEGVFSGSEKSRTFAEWAAVSDGRAAIAVLDSGGTIVYDGKGGYGNYLHARGALAWTRMAETERSTDAWLWIASSDRPWESAREAAAALPPQPVVRATTDRVRRKIDAAEARLRSLPEADRRASWWRVVAARKLEAEGRFDEALRAVEGERPKGWHILEAGDLVAILESVKGGVRVLELLDAAAGVGLLASGASAGTPPLFRIGLRKSGEALDTHLEADRSWGQVDVTRADDGATAIRWSRPGGAGEASLEDLRVTLLATPDPKASAFRWRLRVENESPDWGVRNVVFPLLAVADLGPGAEVVFPRGSGEVAKDAWSRAFRFGGRYPSGWTTMPWMAAYGGAKDSGLYVGAHDPLGSTREILIESRPEERAVVFSFDEPAADMGKPGSSFEPTGETVWQLVRGDWFDAACIYRDWVREGARWWPKLGADGRADTPAWMRELPVWAMTGGPPGSVVPRVKEFAEYLGVPVGFHWYNWHQIPFDNDYPHYFPTKEGFREGVAELQAAGVHVMPYINGRLWDTRDRGAEDFQFGENARPGATKDERGEPYVETYGSRESDGSPVRLAVMCPASAVWREKVGEIVLRLFGQEGVHGVYIDQVAAAQPVLCFDGSHGHPLGGGHWWTEAYWSLLDRIRREMPSGRMITTECNGEPYVHVFDGYLTWHWQYDGQVPAFPAVYGGAVQMFGRAYRGGPTKDLAFRMKAGQQLVFGEQIGWCGPEEIRQPESGAFLRQVVRLRWELRRYFHAGEMARPPKLTGQIPAVTADWQWSGVWPVTTSAVLTGAWSLPRERCLVLLFANVSDAPVDAALRFDASGYGIAAEALSATRIAADGREATIPLPPRFERELSFAARTAWAWEFEPAE